ncbi:DUF2652 domain-containing protein [Ascidiimonas aurantiaca]|uniref:DUF2652 domain-containing protein n=1 Tax=Ascidiimonas aurantiaca TaxID=1685432 RepID=UPI0030EE0A0E
MKKEPTLICIPDISGFTKFMSEMDFELSSKVIPTLLNNIIYNNQIGLEISEIEGDAILFYKKGKVPQLELLIEQCRSFHLEFYKQMYRLEHKYKARKDSIKIPKILGLKIILHLGYDIAPVKIGNHIKLLGEDIILAHRLLKNKVPFDEYILFSEPLMQYYRDTNVKWNTDWGKLFTVNEEIEYLGEILYNYIELRSHEKTD